MGLAIATPSYAGDFERCRLLCASIDRFVRHLDRHYLMVEDADVPRFRALEGPRRIVIPESALLPGWLRPRRDPLARGRRLWTGFGALARGIAPLRGWHVQQLRKLALPRLMDEQVVMFVDSDAFFLRPFDMAGLVEGGATRLYRVPGGIRPDMRNHVGWLRKAEALFGLAPAPLPADDFVNHMVSWHVPTARAMLDAIEARHGEPWVATLSRGRALSEYLVYGTYATRVAPGVAATFRESPLAPIRTYWFPEDVADRSGITLDSLEPHEVGMAFQSFLDVDLESQWAMFRAADARPDR
jgi:hypothetical protein